MKRARYSRRGPVPHELLEVVESPTPSPRAGEALVQVLAAPINPADVLTLTGQYGLLPPLPATGGTEGVGRVLELGAGAGTPPPGSIVLLPPGCGSWATHVLADAGELLPLPDEADPLQLAMMTVNPPTALLMLRGFVELEPGDWVIQNAANSGVGTCVVQLARHRGLKTVNIVRRADAVEGVRACGGDVVLVDGDGLADRVAAATGGAPIRLGIEAVGGGATDRLAAALAAHATLVNYGANSGQPCQLSTAALVFRDIALRGFWRSRWYRQAEPEQRRALLGEIAGLVAAGVLRVPIQATYRLQRIGEAVEAATAGGRSGKIVVVP